MVQINFPVDSVDRFGDPATRYDETDNGLVDVRASWSDAGDGVDPSTVRIELLGEIAGSANSGDDLSGLWTQVQIDDNGLAFEETIAELVRQGSPRLVVSVADFAGNRGADTLDLLVRHGDFHRSISLGGSGIPAPDGVICEDDLRLYVAYGNAIVVIDTQTLELIGSFSAVLPETPSNLLCVEGDPEVYVGVRVDQFDREALMWAGHMSGTFLTDALALSKADPAIIWAGEGTIGVPVRIDRINDERIGEVGFPHSSSTDERVFAIAVLPDDGKIYFSRARETGVISGDPATGEQLAHIDLDPDSPGLGWTQSLAVHPQLFRVYAAVRGVTSGVVEIDPAIDAVSRRLIFVNNAIDVSLNKAGTRMWATTHDSDAQQAAESHLIDPNSLARLQSFPRPVPEGTTTFVLDGSFRPDGKLVFQLRDDDVDVYIIRE